ncbi:MAG: hypothetical protein ACE5GF_02965 [Thermodesulfobacteriota bacterium]
MSFLALFMFFRAILIRSRRVNRENHSTFSTFALSDVFFIIAHLSRRYGLLRRARRGLLAATDDHSEERDVKYEE